MIKKKIIIGTTLFITTSLMLGVIFIPFSFKNNSSSYEGNDQQSRIALKHTVKFNTNGGSELEPVEVEHGQKVKKPDDPIKKGYTAQNWIRSGLLWDFDNDVVVENMTLNLTWDLTTYSITYNLDGGSTDKELKTSYTINDSFELVKPTKSESVFGGWFNDKEERIDSIEAGTTGDLVLNAEWLDNLRVFSEDKSRGDIDVSRSSDNENQVTLRNIPVGGKHHLFKGWYNLDNDLLSQDDEYTFELVPDEINEIHAKYMNDEEEKVWNDNHGFNPKILDGCVQYGFYPQSNVKDIVLISSLKTLNPCSFSDVYYYRGEYYSKLKAKLFKENSGDLPSIRDFDNGQEIVEGNYYWFKLEPIKWKIIEDDSQMKLISEKLLGVKKFYDSSQLRTIDGETVHPNNYKYSLIREWLNSDFYEKAFSFNDSPLIETLVDNSISTTAYSENRFCCENTNDKVFLPSYSDCLNNGTHFLRKSVSTDYCRAQGVRYGTQVGDDLYCGYYFTRSPAENLDYEKGYFVSRCNKKGSLNRDLFNESTSAARPMITISKESLS